MTNLIDIENLGKRYGDFVLTGVNLAVEPGTVVGFIGSNGAGKTTTIEGGFGTHHRRRGHRAPVRTVAAPGSAAVEELKSRIGVVLDTCAFPSTCRVGDIASIGRVAYATWDDARWNELTALFQLAPKRRWPTCPAAWA